MAVISRNHQPLGKGHKLDSQPWSLATTSLCSWICVCAAQMKPSIQSSGFECAASSSQTCKYLEGHDLIMRDQRPAGRVQMNVNVCLTSLKVIQAFESAYAPCLHAQSMQCIFCALLTCSWVDVPSCVHLRLEAAARMTISCRH